MTTRTITFDDEQWQVVPKEATMYQVAVGATHSSSGDHMVARGQAVAIYDDMLAAAPEPPAQQPIRIAPGMPEYDALMDHIYEYGTSAEGVRELVEKLVRTASDLPGQQPMTGGARDVPAERRRQIGAEGMTNRALLALAAVLMALAWWMLA